MGGQAAFTCSFSTETVYALQCSKLDHNLAKWNVETG